MSNDKPEGQPFSAVPPTPPGGRDVYVDSAPAYPAEAPYQSAPHLPRPPEPRSARTMILVAVAIIVAGMLLGVFVSLD